MNATMNRVLALGLALAVSLGCSNTRENQEPAPRTTESSTNKSSTASSSSSSTSATMPTVREGMVWSQRAYPTGDKRTSAVLIERGTPTEVSVGQNYDYVIRVTNLTSNSLENVVVADKLTDGTLDVRDASPRPDKLGNDMRWVLGNLAPRKSKEIRVSGSASAVGAIAHCADIRYDAVVCATVKVTQPKLELVKSGTQAALICDPIVYKLTVANNGTGVAKNVKIEDKLPAGMTTLGGNKVVRFDAGDLAPGQSKNYSIRAKASKTGSFSNQASATATGLTAKSGSVTTNVTAPQLTITKTGSKKSFIGRQISYEMTIKNTGNGIAKDTVLRDPLPAGTTFVKASDGGTLTGDVVTWNFGTMKPGATRTVNLSIRAGSATVRNTATVRAYCAEAVSASWETKVTGIPAVLLEVVDVEDPIEVGGNVTYVISVTNQGSARDTNIRIACVMEDTMTYVSNGGATKGSLDGSRITFEPLATLAPKAKATWRLTVKAKATGDVRFTVIMNTDELKRPVQETEATNFYE